MAHRAQTSKRKKSTVEPNWKVVIFGAAIFFAFGLGLLIVFKTGWDMGRENMPHQQAIVRK